MKKLLVLLAAFGLTASTATTVIACDTGNDNNKLVNEVYKKISKPKDINELTKMEEVITKGSVEVVTEINKDVYGTKIAPEKPTKEQHEAFYNHKKIQVLFAYAICGDYLEANKGILNNDKVSAQDWITSLKEKGKEQSEGDLTVKPSKLNKQKIDQFVSELEEDISKLT